MAKFDSYHYNSGDVIVIGPECFADLDEQVICWRGINYYSAVHWQPAEEDNSYNDHEPLT